MNFRTILCVVVVVVVVVIDRSETATKGPMVSKCCGLADSVVVANGALTCTPTPPGTPAPEWRPVVYSKRKQALLERTPRAWTVREATRPACGAFNATVLTQGYLILESGSLFYDNARISADKFCVENNAVLVCLSDVVQPDVRKQHVRKCCGQGGVYSTESVRCVVSNRTDFDITGREKQPFSVISGFPTCTNNTVEFVEFVVAGNLSRYELQNDGSLAARDIETDRIAPAAFCMEHFLEDSEGIHILACPEAVSRPQVAYDLRFTLYPIGLLISVVFLIATLATGYLLPSSHHVLHWRCQTNYVACLLVGDVCLAVTQLAGHQITGACCIIIATLMHFVFLAAFFWLNTMCFNIWWTFRDLRPASLEKGQEACRLRLYEVYAWGGPLLIAGIAAILDNLPDDQGYSFLRPQFGRETCWFFGDMEILTYFFGPVGVLLAINLVLFGLTARELTCGLWKREVVKSNTERAALGRICLKLVVVMGISWGADVLSWVAGGPQAIWYLTDVINTLQGLFIFIVIGCQPLVWAAFKRLWCLRQNHTSGTTGNGNHHSSSSHGLPSLGDSVTNHTLTNTTNISCKSTIPLETSC